MPRLRPPGVAAADDGRFPRPAGEAQLHHAPGIDFERRSDPQTDPVTALSIAEAAARAGLTTHTLRYYERDGLMLAPVDRSASGHRRYTERDLTWIELITRLRSTGMPIREVRRYADLVRAGDGNEAERLACSAHRERVEASWPR